MKPSRCPMCKREKRFINKRKAVVIAFIAGKQLRSPMNLNEEGSQSGYLEHCLLYNSFDYLFYPSTFIQLY